MSDVDPAPGPEDPRPDPERPEDRVPDPPPPGETPSDPPPPEPAPASTPDPAPEPGTPALPPRLESSPETERALFKPVQGFQRAGTLGTRFDARRKEVYLSHLRATGEKQAARILVGVSPETIYRHRKGDPDFRLAEEDAMESYRAVIAGEIHRRAIEGVPEPVWDKDGNRIGEKLRYSDRLLLAHARRHIPEYREEVSVNQRVSGAVGVVIAPLGLDTLSKEGRALLRKLLETEGAKLPEAFGDRPVIEGEAVEVKAKAEDEGSEDGEG